MIKFSSIWICLVIQLNDRRNDSRDGGALMRMRSFSYALRMRRVQIAFLDCHGFISLSLLTVHCVKHIFSVESKLETVLQAME